MTPCFPCTHVTGFFAAGVLFAPMSDPGENPLRAAMRKAGNSLAACNRGNWYIVDEPAVVTYPFWAVRVTKQPNIHCVAAVCGKSHVVYAA